MSNGVIVLIVVLNWVAGLTVAIAMGVSANDSAGYQTAKGEARMALLCLLVGGFWLLPLGIVMGITKLWRLADFKRAPKNEIPKAKVIP